MNIDFPETYIDLDRQRFQENCLEIRKLSEGISLRTERNPDSVISTGTTVVGLLTRDKKAGIIISDGQATAGSRAVKEDFKKVFDCRNGFVGVAGDAGLVQRIIPKFRLDLTSVSDARGELMTASGAAERLFGYQHATISSAMKHGMLSMAFFIALFWDAGDESCHLYSMEGTLFKHDRGVTIGSGGELITLDIKDFDPPDSADELLEKGIQLVLRAGEADKATNRMIFYGLIKNGEFVLGKEDLR